MELDIVELMKIPQKAILGADDGENTFNSDLIASILEIQDIKDQNTKTIFKNLSILLTIMNINGNIINPMILMSKLILELKKEMEEIVTMVEKINVQTNPNKINEIIEENIKTYNDETLNLLKYESSKMMKNFMENGIELPMKKMEIDVKKYINKKYREKIRSENKKEMTKVKNEILKKITEEIGVTKTNKKIREKFIENSTDSSSDKEDNSIAYQNNFLKFNGNIEYIMMNKNNNNNNKIMDVDTKKTKDDGRTGKIKDLEQKKLISKSAEKIDPAKMIQFSEGGEVSGIPGIKDKNHYLLQIANKVANLEMKFSRPEVVCNKCGLKNHYAYNCKMRDPCSGCGSYNHILIKCKNTIEQKKASVYTCQLCQSFDHDYRNCERYLNIRIVRCQVCNKAGHGAEHCLAPAQGELKWRGLSSFKKKKKRIYFINNARGTSSNRGHRGNLRGGRGGFKNLRGRGRGGY
jgi:hypothetical protein